MILVADIGNSNVVVGGVEAEQIIFEARLRTDATKTSDEYCIDVKNILDIYNVNKEDIEGSIIASVVPQVLNTFMSAHQAFIAHFVCIATFQTSITRNIKCKIRNIAIENPSQTGADLVVGSVAALREHKAPLIVIDMGTATTMVVLDKNGSLIGGSISPGVKISLDALTGGTALLPGLQLDQPKRAIGRNTADCMRSGIMMGAACMLDGMIERMEEELGYKTKVVVTGGIAKFIVPMCRREMTYDKDLLVKGLATLYRENKRS